jgi:hypothetical protein
MIKDKEHWANHVPIPAHIFAALRATAEHMIVFGQAPDVDAIMFTAMMLGLDDQFGLVAWLSTHKEDYERGVRYGFFSWNVN